MIELPKDANGRVIPLDTKVLYDECGNEYEVHRYCCSVRQSIPERVWEAVMLDTLTYYTSRLYLEPPDSWEKLEEDLHRIDIGASGWFCMYAGYGKDDDSCHSECKFFEDKTPCDRQAARDIVSRIRKLRGEDDA